MRHLLLIYVIHRSATHIAVLFSCLLALAACTAPGWTRPDTQAIVLAEPVKLLVEVDGTTQEISTNAETVGQALELAGIAIGPADEVAPPITTEISVSGSNRPIEISIARVTEAIEVIPEGIPYQRRLVRSAEMSPDDPPRLLQTGSPGLQEVSVRIVFRDGLEVERWPVSTTIIEPPVDEIIMIGVSASRDITTVLGRLAYIDDGRAVLLQGSTNTPRQIPIDGTLDGRVFQLSPDGSYLLFTKTIEDAQDRFGNELWVIATAEGAQAQSLQIENVLWAAWDPAALDIPRIAYTTARSIALPPGWEAINDLWLLSLPLAGEQPLPTRLIESYPAAFGWWGGSYAWAPDGRRLAYAFADEIGLIDISDSAAIQELNPVAASEPARTVIHTFTAYDTGADWAWLPALNWSADSRYLSFTDHAGDSGRFDLWLIDTLTGNKVVLREGVGIWSAAQWSPASALPDMKLAYLQANNPDEGLDSSYSLNLSDSDGSNARRIFPPAGEVANFARNSLSIAWGPDVNSIAFIVEDTLHIVDVTTGEVFRNATDDTISSHPTWAPYGAAAGR